MRSHELAPNQPITLEVYGDHQHLYYFGSNHSQDPTRPQYPILRQYWDDFQKENTGNKRIVLVEGTLRNVAPNSERAIHDSGEGGFITFLAHEADVEVACPDISDREMIKLLPEISIEEFQLYDFLVWMNHRQSSNSPTADFLEEAKRWCIDQNENPLYEGNSLDWHILMRIFTEATGADLDSNTIANNLINPNISGTRVNEIARITSDRRDERILSVIRRYWEEGYSMFTVFDKGHLIIQEPALLELGNRKARD